MLYLGCPQWGSTHWKGRVLSSDCKTNQMLGQYAQIFNSVEGNTTFYADPSADSIQRWQAAVPNDFKFTFKLAKRFTHDMALVNCQAQFTEWLRLFEPLFERTGSIMVQLPRSFSPSELPTLSHFIQQLPKELSFSVEIRHPAFFKKDDHEKRLNQLLIAHDVDRIMMDTRPLFSEAPNSPAIIDAQQKKPRLPVHVIATASQPIVRFVGCSTLTANRQFYQPWLKKIKQWLAEGKSPYVFFHTADNFDAPFLARQFIEDLQIDHRVLAPFPYEKEAHQSSLF